MHGYLKKVVAELTQDETEFLRDGDTLQLSINTHYPNPSNR